MTAQRTHIVVIGGGYAGTLAANHLRLRADVEITLVNPRPVFVERIRLHQLVAGTRDADTLTELVWAALHGLVTLNRSGRLRPEYQTARVDLLVAEFAAATPP